MKKYFFRNTWRRCLAATLASAMAITGISPDIASVTVKAAEEEPYVISLNRPAYASSHNGGDTADKAFDGDINTRWQAQQDDKNEWIYTDLGKVAKITKVYLSWEAAAASKYSVQFSDDEVEWKDVYTVTDGKERDERTLPVSGQARYVRIQCDKRLTDWGCSLYEFQVYGTDGLAQRPVDYGENIALNKETKASAARLEWWMRIGANNDNWESVRDDLFEKGYPVDADGKLITDKSRVSLINEYLCYDNDKGKTVLDQRSVLPKNTVDGQYDNNCWHTNGGDANKRNYDEWMYVDLGAEYEIGRIVLKWKDAARAYRIEVSDNAADWTTIYSRMNECAVDKDIPVYAKGRYVRVYCIAPWDFGSGIGISELEVYKFRAGTDEKVTYEIEKEPEVKKVSVQGSDATYATDDIRFPMAKPPAYLDESLQMPEQPVASNDWWQTITIKDLGDGLVALPYRTKYTTAGLNITEVNDCWYESDNPNPGGLGSAVVNSLTDITLSPDGMDTSKIYDQIIDYSDFAIKAQLCDANGPVMTNTIIKGSPYIFSEFGDKQDVVIYSANITEVFDKSGKKILEEQNKEMTLDNFGIEITDDDNKKKTKTSVSLFCVNLPAGTTVKRAGNKLKIHFKNKNGYMSIGAIPNKTDMMTFYQHGYAFVKDTSVTYDYDEQTSKITTHYKMETEVKRAGFNEDTIQCLFPHQYKKLSSGNPVKDSLSYITTRGTMKGCVLKDNQFETQDIFYGMVPQFTRPQDTEDTKLADGTVIPGYSDELVTKYLSQIEKNTHDIEKLPGGDAYWQGKSLHPLALATLVADQNGNMDYRDMFLERLRYIFDDWFTYSGQDDEIYFYYDKNWGTLYYRYSEFGANWGICDHHFTYGYFLFAAAVLATYDEEFYEQYKEMLDLIVRDFASPYEDDSLFCRFRSFDLYEGHSWAGGYADNDTGNNQEAGGESLFGWVGMYLWSVRSGNKDFRDASIFGFTTELNDVEQYWFNYDRDNWPEDYPHYIVGQNYGASIFYGTFFDGNSVSVYGIHWLPVTEWISHYSMGKHRKEELENMYEGFLKEIDAQRDAEKEENKKLVKTPLTNWQHIFVPLKSQFDPDGALDDYWKVCNGQVKNGEGTVVDFDNNEQFNAYWFAHSMRDLGNKTDEIRPVGGLSASVYKKGDKYTALAWNPTEDDMLFEFTDGEKIVGSATIGSKSLVRFDPFAKDIVQVATPEFSLASDLYDDTQYLKITTSTEGAKIHYTTDGSNPSADSPVYTERIPVSSTTTIKAVALKDGYIDSKFEAVTIEIAGSTITTGKNIAIGKSATASSENGGNKAQNITDENASTRWETAKGSNDEYNPSDWCTIDLEKEYTINKVKISWEAAYASKYKIQVSTDNKTWTDVYIENAGDGKFDEIIFDPVAARYVRMQGVERGSTYGYSIYEMGVYEARQIATPQFSLPSGTYNGNQMLSIASATQAVEIHYTTDGTEPTKDSPLYIPRLALWQNVTIKAKAFKLGMLPSGTAEANYTITGGTQPAGGDTYDENNPFQPEPEDEIEEEPLAGEVAAPEDPYLKKCLSYQKYVYVSSSENKDTDQNITDGNENSTWSSAWQDISNEERFDQWCYIDLKESVTFNEVRIIWNTINNHYKIQVSDDAKNWKDVYINTKDSDSSNIDICRFDEVKARYVKMQGIKVGQGWGYSMREMMVYLSDEEQPLGQNMGAGIAATSSAVGTDNPNNNISFINDGKTNTVWEPGSDDAQTVTLNLFKTYEVDKVVLDIKDGYEGTLEIAVSTDGENWKPVTDNTRAARYGIISSEDGVYKFDPELAKYVKADFSTGANLGIREFEVYTVGSADVAKVEIDYYKAIGAGASTKNEDIGKIIDNDTTSTRWQAEKEDTEAWCYIDLGEAKEVNFVSVFWEASCAELYDIYLADELDSNGKPVLGELAYKGETGKAGLVETVLTNPGTARYVVLKQTKPSGYAASYGCSLFELQAGRRKPIPVERVSAWPSKTTTLAIGQTLDTVCIVSPSNADNTDVTWESSNKKVATVSSKGVIKGIKAGEAVITVKSAANPAKKAEIHINVTGPLDAPRPKAERTGDDEITITWTGSENAIGYNIYRSKSQKSGYKKLNDKLLAEPRYVDKGLAKGTYYYKIEFIADEKNTVYRNSAKSTQSVGIKIQITDITLTIEQGQYEVEAGKSVAIEAKVTPVNTKITWESSNTDVATVKDGVVTGVKEGTATITAKAGSKTAVCTVNVTPAKAQNTPEPGNSEEPGLPGNQDTPEPGNQDTPEPGNTSTSIPGQSGSPEQSGEPSGSKEPSPTQKPSGSQGGSSGSNSGGGSGVAYPGNFATQTPAPDSTQTPDIAVTPEPDNTFLPTTTIVPTQAPGGTLLPVTGNTPETGVNTSASTPGPGNTSASTPEPSGIPENMTKLEILAANHPYGVKTATIAKKGKLVLKVNITGDGVTSQKVKWSSSDKKIASVNSKGTVKAKNKTGTAVITAQSVEDSTKKVSINVKVVAKETPNKVLKLKKTKVKMDKKGQKTQIKIKKYTKKTTDLVYYKVKSGKKYIKVNKYGKITCKKKPSNKNTKAKVQVKYGNKKKTVTVTVTKKK